MYFPLGGGTLKGVGKPGEIAWSRVFVMDGCLHAGPGWGPSSPDPVRESASSGTPPQSSGPRCALSCAAWAESR